MIALKIPPYHTTKTALCGPLGHLNWVVAIAQFTMNLQAGSEGIARYSMLGVEPGARPMFSVRARVPLANGRDGRTEAVRCHLARVERETATALAALAFDQIRDRKKLVGTLQPPVTLHAALPP